MALYYAPLTLQQTLEQKGERILKRKSDVLFRRGEEAFGMFVVLCHTNAKKLPNDRRRY